MGQLARTIVRIGSVGGKAGKDAMFFQHSSSELKDSPLSIKHSPFIEIYVLSTTPSQYRKGKVLLALLRNRIIQRNCYPVGLIVGVKAEFANNPATVQVDFWKLLK